MITKTNIRKDNNALLRGQLDHKKEYAVEYTNKHNNFISTTLKGKERK